MNMISTGAFLNEMDASNKQPTVAEKFAAVWEKKNAKAARAGGVSLMALSLAACGGSSSTTSTSTTTTTTTPATDAAKSFTLTTNPDSGADFTGGSGNDTYTASATTFTALDKLDGGTGTDTLNVVAAGALATAPAGVELTSIEAVNISSGGAIGVVAGTTAVAEEIKFSMPTVTANVAQKNTYSFDGGSDDASFTFTYDGNNGSFAYDADEQVGNAEDAFVTALNAVAGSTVATVVKGAERTVTDNTLAAAVVSDSTSVGMVTDAGIEVGMFVTDGAGQSNTIPVGTRVTAISSDTLTLSNKVTLAASEELVFSDSIVEVASPTAGVSLPSISFETSTVVTQALDTANVTGNVGDIVTVSFGDLSTTFVIGADAAATADNLVAALNALSAETIADEGSYTGSVFTAGNSGSVVQVKSATAGDALPTITFTGAAGNIPSATLITANVVGGDTAAAYDMSGIETAKVTVTEATSANMKVLTTSDVDISGVTGAVTVDGGKDVVVTDATADKAIFLENMKGSATVTDSKQGTASITIDDAVGVTVDADDQSTGAITIGGGTAVTGAVDIDATGAAYATTTANTTLGAITVTGGSTVDINQSATSSTAKAVADTANTTITQSDTTVNAGDATTSVTIIQDKAVSANDAVEAVAAVPATYTMTFEAASSGQTVIIGFDNATFGSASDKLTFTASKALTAEEVASAFANLSKNATEGSAPATDGVYTNAGTIDTGWTSGAVTTNADGTKATVTFSNETITAVMSKGGTATTSLGAKVAGKDEVLAETGAMGVINGAVDINGTSSGDDALKTVTLTNFASAAIDTDVIETLNVTGSAGAAIVTTASTGSVTINAADLASGSQVSLDGAPATVTGVTLNVSGEDGFTGDLVASAATSLTIDATTDFTSENGTDIDAVKTLIVKGAGAVDLGTVSAGLAGTATSIDASGNSGGLTITYGSDTGTFTGGSGDDVVTTDAEAVSKAVDLGAGDDTFIFSASHSSGPSATKTLDGGDGIDTITLNSGNAAAADDNGDFGGDLTGFERLSLGVLGNVNINTKNLGLNSYVTTAGTSSSGSTAATLSGLTADATVVLTAAGAVTVDLDDDSGTADSINLVMEADGTLDVLDVVTTNIETVNLSSVDKFKDVTGAKDEFGANIGDGKDDTNSVQNIDINSDTTKAINVTGNSDLTINIDVASSASGLTSLDASAFTGKLTVTVDGKSTGTTVKGGSGDDTLVASGSNDILIGGAGDDKITTTTLTTATGGEGADTFVFQTSVAATTYSTITDLGSGDIIQLIDGSSGNSFTTTAITSSSQTTFAAMLDLAVDETTSNTNVTDSAWFQYDGNTYIVQETGSNGSTFDTGDVIVEIEGLHDLSAAIFNATTSTLEIA